MAAAGNDVAAALRERLAALAPVEVRIKDDSRLHRHHAEGGSGAHLRLRIVSDHFAGKTPLARHRMVYQAAGNIAAAGIHALAINALTPAESARENAGGAR